MSQTTMTAGAESIAAEPTVLTIGTSTGIRAIPIGPRDAPGASVPAGFDGAEVTALHVSADAMWVLVGRRELHRCAGGRATLIAELHAPDGRCVVEHDGDVFVGGARADLWRLRGDVLEPVDGFHGAPTSDRWYTPWGGPPDVFSMASHRTDRAADLYVGVHVGGILRSSDGGRSFTPTIDLDEDVHEVVTDAEGGLWAATGRSGLAHSADCGESWSFHTDGLHAPYALAVATLDDAVLVGVSSGHSGRDGALYRFDGSGFERCADGLPDAFDGAVSPRQLAGAGRVAAVALPSGDVHVSTDGGRVWRRVATALAGVSELSMRPLA